LNGGKEPKGDKVAGQLAKEARTVEAYDVVVVGGGAAGLSGAVLLARSRRSVLVIDAGEPRNARAEGVHNFLSRDGTSPATLLAAGRSELRAYGGEVWDGRVTSAARDGDGFTVTLDDGRMAGARRLLVTTGVVDELPDVPGVRERWGYDVVHCPYCHGWEVRDEAAGVLATAATWAMALHQALLFRQLTENLTLFLHTAPEPAAEEHAQLDARGVAIVCGAVERVVVTDGHLSGVRLASGEVVPLQALAVQPRSLANSPMLAALGLEPTDHPMGVGTFYAADAMGQTSVPGVWVAGNVTDLASTVIGAAAAGAKAGSAINADLVAEDVKRARRQTPGSAAPDRSSSPVRFSPRAHSYPAKEAAAYDHRVTDQHPDHHRDHITEGHRTHHFDPARVDRLLNEDRQRMLPAESMLRAAGVAAGQIVVDLGAGPGFFTLPAARLVGAGGHVYAVDVEPQMLDLCRRRAEEAGLTGIETVHSAESRIPLPDATADRVLIAFVLHEADDVAALLREAARLLRPDGEIAVAEWLKVEGTPGPPLDHRIGEDDLAGFAAQVGLHTVPTDHRSENYYLARLAR
jgi:thioredoxin reductase/SAM-dependent methyltransferase